MQYSKIAVALLGLSVALCADNIDADKNISKTATELIENALSSTEKSVPARDSEVKEEVMNSVFDLEKDKSKIENTPTSVLVTAPDFSMGGKDCVDNIAGKGSSARKVFKISLTSLGEKPLSNIEINKVFLSFLKQREMERIRVIEEKERKAREAREAKEAELKKTLKKKNPYYGMSPDQAKNARDHIQGGGVSAPHIPTAEEILAQKIAQKAAEAKAALYQAMQIEMYIYGTSCYKKKCVAFTSLGTIEKGKTITATNEKVLEVDPEYIKTNLRKIKF